MQTLYSSSVPPGLTAPTRGELKIRIERLQLHHESLAEVPAVAPYLKSVKPQMAVTDEVQQSSIATDPVELKSLLDQFEENLVVVPLFWGENPAIHSAECYPVTDNLSEKRTITTIISPIKTVHAQLAQYFHYAAMSPLKGLPLRLVLPSSKTGKRQAVEVGSATINLSALGPTTPISGWYEIVGQNAQGELVGLGRLKVHVSANYYQESSAVEGPKADATKTAAPRPLAKGAPRPSAQKTPIRPSEAPVNPTEVVHPRRELAVAKDHPPTQTLTIAEFLSMHFTGVSPELKANVISEWVAKGLPEKGTEATLLPLFDAFMENNDSDNDSCTPVAGDTASVPTCLPKNAPKNQGKFSTATACNTTYRTAMADSGTIHSASKSKDDGNNLKFRVLVSPENVAKNNAMLQVHKEPIGPSSYIKASRQNNNCRDCGKRGTRGNKDSGDGCFYCDACWEVRKAKAIASAGPSADLTAATEASGPAGSDATSFSPPVRPSVNYSNNVAPNAARSNNDMPPPAEGSRSHRSGTLPLSLSELWQTTQARTSSVMHQQHPTYTASDYDVDDDDDEGTYVKKGSGISKVSPASKVLSLAELENLQRKYIFGPTPSLKAKGKVSEPVPPSPSYLQHTQRGRAVICKDYYSNKGQGHNADQTQKPKDTTMIGVERRFFDMPANTNSNDNLRPKEKREFHHTTGEKRTSNRDRETFEEGYHYEMKAAEIQRRMLQETIEIEMAKLRTAREQKAVEDALKIANSRSSSFSDPLNDVDAIFKVIRGQDSGSDEDQEPQTEVDWAQRSRFFDAEVSYSEDEVMPTARVASLAHDPKDLMRALGQPIWQSAVDEVVAAPDEHAPATDLDISEFEKYFQQGPPASKVLSLAELENQLISGSSTRLSSPTSKFPAPVPSSLVANDSAPCPPDIATPPSYELSNPQFLQQTEQSPACVVTLAMPSSVTETAPTSAVYEKVCGSCRDEGSEPDLTIAEFLAKHFAGVPPAMITTVISEWVAKGLPEKGTEATLQTIFADFWEKLDEGAEASPPVTDVAPDIDRLESPMMPKRGVLDETSSTYIVDEELVDEVQVPVPLSAVANDSAPCPPDSTPPSYELSNPQFLQHTEQSPARVVPLAMPSSVTEAVSTSAVYEKVCGSCRDEGSEQVLTIAEFLAKHFAGVSPSMITTVISEWVAKGLPEKGTEVTLLPIFRDFLAKLDAEADSCKEVAADETNGPPTLTIAEFLSMHFPEVPPETKANVISKWEANGLPENGTEATLLPLFRDLLDKLDEGSDAGPPVTDAAPEVDSLNSSMLPQSEVLDETRNGCMMGEELVDDETNGPSTLTIAEFLSKEVPDISPEFKAFLISGWEAQGLPEKGTEATLLPIFKDFLKKDAEADEDEDDVNTPSDVTACVSSAKSIHMSDRNQSIDPPVTWIPLPSILCQSFLRQRPCLNNPCGFFHGDRTALTAAHDLGHNAYNLRDGTTDSRAEVVMPPESTHQVPPNSSASCAPQINLQSYIQTQGSTSQTQGAIINSQQITSLSHCSSTDMADQIVDPPGTWIPLPRTLCNSFQINKPCPKNPCRFFHGDQAALFAARSLGHNAYNIHDRTTDNRTAVEFSRVPRTESPSIVTIVQLPSYPAGGTTPLRQQSPLFPPPEAAFFSQMRAPMRPMSQMQGPAPSQYQGPMSKMQGPAPSQYQGPMSKMQGPPTQYQGPMPHNQMQGPAPSQYQGPMPSNQMQGPMRQMQGPMPSNQVQGPPSQYQRPMPHNQMQGPAPSQYQGPMSQMQGPAPSQYQRPMPHSQMQGPMPSNQVQGPPSQYQRPMPHNQMQGPAPSQYQGPMSQMQGPAPSQYQGPMPHSQMQGPPNQYQGPMPPSQYQRPMPHSQMQGPPNQYQGPMPHSQMQGPMPSNQVQGPCQQPHLNQTFYSSSPQ